MKLKTFKKMKNDRATILGLIKEKRAILFGRYSDTLTHKLKMETWASIYKRGCSMGILDPSKGWRYFRDTVWQNWKKRSLKRVYNRKQSRSVSNNKSKLDEIDKTVLEIVGSAALKEEPLNSKYTVDEFNNAAQDITCDNRTNGEPMVNIPEPSETESHNTYEADSHHTSESFYSLTTAANNQQESSRNTKEELELRMIKIKLELLERDAYIKDIEIYKKEKEAGLPMSTFTKKFYREDLNISGENNCDCDSIISQCKLESD